MNTSITIDHFKHYPWRDIFQTTEPPFAFEFAKAFSAAASQCFERGDKRGGKVYSFLSRVCKWQAPDKTEQSEEDEERWELNDEDCETAEELLRNTTDPEFRALLADMLSEEYLEDKELSRTAAESYLAAFLRVPPDRENQQQRVEFILRGLHLVARCEAHALLEKYHQAIRPLLSAEHPAALNKNQRMWLISNMLECGIGDYLENARFVEQAVSMKSESDKGWQLGLAARLYRAAGDNENHVRLGRLCAEQYLMLADIQVAKRPTWQWGDAVRFIRYALKALRDSGADITLITEVRRRLRTLRRASLRKDEVAIIEWMRKLDYDGRDQILRAVNMAAVLHLDSKAREKQSEVDNTEQARDLMDYLLSIARDAFPDLGYDFMGWANRLEGSGELWEFLNEACCDESIVSVLLGPADNDEHFARALRQSIPYEFDRFFHQSHKSVLSEYPSIQVEPLLEFIREWRANFFRRLSESDKRENADVSE